MLPKICYYINPDNVIVEQVNSRVINDITFYGWTKDEWEDEANRDSRRVCVWKMKQSTTNQSKNKN